MLFGSIGHLYKAMLLRKGDIAKLPNIARQTQRVRQNEETEYFLNQIISVTDEHHDLLPLPLDSIVRNKV